MRSFDEFCKKHELKRNLDYVELAWEAGQQSKQDEVDELQKRIDEALKFANDAHSDLNIGMLKMVEILKGEQS